MVFLSYSIPPTFCQKKIWQQQWDSYIFYVRILFFMWNEMSKDLGPVKEELKTGEIVLYKASDGSTEIDVKFENETVWLNEMQISHLFQRDRTVVNRHINAIFKEWELEKKSNVHFLHIPNSDKPVAFYNLDIIISIWYRVKSLRWTQFRIRATQRLKDYLIKWYALNQKRLEETKLNELEQVVALIKKNIQHGELNFCQKKIWQ